MIIVVLQLTNKGREVCIKTRPWLPDLPQSDCWRLMLDSSILQKAFVQRTENTVTTTCCSVGALCYKIWTYPLMEKDQALFFADKQV